MCCEVSTCAAMPVCDSEIISLKITQISWNNCYGSERVAQESKYSLFYDWQFFRLSTDWKTKNQNTWILAISCIFIIHILLKNIYSGKTVVQIIAGKESHKLWFSVPKWTLCCSRQGNMLAYWNDFDEKLKTILI